VRHGVQFSTAFHTRYPDYVHARFRLPHAWVWSFLRWFHKPAVSVMAPTETMRAELSAQGIVRACVWSRGVDLGLFGGARTTDLPWPKPVWLSVGRLAVEKNLEAFLSLDLPGTKVVVGDGPQAGALRDRFKDTVFTGAKFGSDLARLYSGADVFVFPSRTDTFGLVILEALAAGTPVAAYPVQGPRDVLGASPAGVMDEDLGAACRRALTIPSEICRDFAKRFTWEAAARQFLSHLAIPDFDPELDVSPAWRDAGAVPITQGLQAAS
jgi:glycosyltransferase involved in cell wall biosynthesis